MKNILALLCLFAFCLPFYAVELNAQDAQSIKQNMVKRLPRINELKKKGLIGETHKGYLGAVKASLPAAERKLMDEENADRKKVYEAIAKQQGSSPILVGERRAKTLFSQAKSGEFLQENNGNWRQK
ncbi:MAG: YdbL family protein [Lentisphaeria bacterium]|nr:YdbL family protein [Lentisphaeria bacterium]MDY0175750.1 YdbL family protein [Lentisphaeria bacterium]NLZ60481.1 YdbL family protein [Lentisphaerota bacterium]